MWCTKIIPRVEIQQENYQLTELPARMAVRYASIVVKKYGTLVRYAFFFYNGTDTVRWYGTPFLQWYGTLVRCLNLPTKRFMCNVRPSMKICATVPGVHILYAIP